MPQLFENDALPEGQDSVVTKGAMAEMLGLHPSRVSQLIKQGMPVRPDGKLDKPVCLNWYERNINNRQRPRPESPTTSALKAEREQVRLEKDRLLLSQARGELIERETVKHTIQARAEYERDAWLSWPMRAAPMIAEATGGDEARIFATLGQLVREQLTTLADTALEIDDA